MANTAKYSKESVIEAGLVQLREGGWEELTPKKVAKRLGASTMPIYSHFPTMETYRMELMDKAWQMLERYALSEYTGDSWIDHGVGYVLFARDHGQLFTSMHSERLEEVQRRRYEFWVTISNDLKDHSLFEGMDPELVGWVRNMRSFLVYGIAVSVNTGLTPVWEKEEVIRQMISLCSKVLFEGLLKRKDQLGDVLKLIPLDVRERVSGVTLT